MVILLGNLNSKSGHKINAIKPAVICNNTVMDTKEIFY